MSEKKQWKAERALVPQVGGFQTWVVSEDGEWICVMDCPGSEAETHALLVAAAPDLLEACKEAVANHDAWAVIREINAEKNGRPVPAEPKHIQLARAALAKAGE